MPGGGGESTDEREEDTMNVASRGATMAVDWEQRIDFARLRSDRLEKARASLRDSRSGRCSSSTRTTSAT